MRKEPIPIAGNENPWRRLRCCAIAWSLYTDKASAHLFKSFGLAVEQVPQMHTELSIEVQGVTSPCPVKHFLNPLERLASVFSWQTHKLSIALLSFFPSECPLYWSVSLFSFIYWPVSLCATQVTPTYFSFNLKLLLIRHHLRLNY